MATTSIIPNEGFPEQRPPYASIGKLAIPTARETGTSLTSEFEAEFAGTVPTFEDTESAEPLSKDDVTEKFRSPALRSEISAVEAAGYDISVGNTQDTAYERPEKIQNMFDKLNYLGQQFTRVKAGLSAPRTGRLALGLPLPGRDGRKQAKREYSAALEEARSNLIYTSVEGQPWHDQRGCATALLTITGAHELAVGDEPGYPTMSALLDKSVLDYTFPEGGELSGLSLREAIIYTGEAYRGKSRESATRFADQQLDKLTTFLNAPVTEEFKDIVAYCTDSLGIRSRREEVATEINRYVDVRLEDDPEFTEVTMMSIGCGTALPILEVAAGMKEKGVTPKLILLDQDPIALASAAQLAKKLGLEDNIEIHCERLFSDMGKPLDIDKVLDGRKLDIAEDSGLREYLPPRVYVAITRQIWNSLGENSLMTTGNMNANRPQAEFLHGLMGWAPDVQMRTIQQGIDLHHKAGVPKDALRMRVTQDGVYTLYFSSKPPVTVRNK